MKYSFPRLIEALTQETGLVLATIVDAEGSTPQVPGASAVFSGAGLVAGTVGGGLLEARIEALAGAALRDGQARLATVRLDADPADMEGAICGGVAKVLVDPGAGGQREVFVKALEGIRKRHPGYLITRIRPAGGDIVGVERGWLPASAAHIASGGGLAELGPDILDGALRGGTTRLVEARDGWTFVEPVMPLPRLVVAGAGHVGRSVARLGALLDWSVTVIDDRPEFANAANVPEADEVVVGDIGAAVRAVEDSPDNYFVIVTRGHQKDAEALRAALGRPAAYVGMIGSRRKVELMRAEFVRNGWATAEAWGRVRAPIGLPIGSQTVEEIAVSIAAELVRVRSEKRGGGGR